VADATIAGSAAVSAAYTLGVTDVNEAIVLVNTTLSLPENTSTATRIKVAEIAVTNDALAAATFTLSGADASTFEVDGTSLYLRAGVSLDFETKALYEVTVNGADVAIVDSTPVSTHLTLAVTDVNEGPTAVTLVDRTTSLPENTTTASRIKVANIVVTDDALGGNEILLSGADAPHFEIDGTALYLKAGVQLDFENKTSYEITINAEDTAVADSTPVSTTFTLAVTDVNEAPTAVALVNTTAALPEDTSTATRIKLADIVITDDAIGTNVISLSGADASSFEVDRTGLYLNAGVSLVYATQQSYGVTLFVHDPTIADSLSLESRFSFSLIPTAVNFTITDGRAINSLQLNTPDSSLSEAITSTLGEQKKFEAWAYAIEQDVSSSYFGNASEELYGFDPSVATASSSVFAQRTDFIPLPTPVAIVRFEASASLYVGAPVLHERTADGYVWEIAVFSASIQLKEYSYSASVALSFSLSFSIDSASTVRTYLSEYSVVQGSWISFNDSGPVSGSSALNVSYTLESTAGTTGFDKLIYVYAVTQF
jgi:hypothetical protein